MKTAIPSLDTLVRDWHLIDADGEVLGRVASKAALALMGKHKPTYTPFLDTGDHVIVINAEKVKITGMKAEQKVYQHYTGYPGGLRTEDFRKRFAKRPELVVEQAVLRMLPKSKLGRQMISKLKVYRGDKHPHQAQKPEALAAKA